MSRGRWRARRVKVEKRKSAPVGGEGEGDHVSEMQEFAVNTNEEGEEYIGVITMVADGEVELSPLVREGDTEASVGERVNRLGDRLFSQPSSQKYFGIVRLYRTGEARPLLVGCVPDSYGRKAQKIALRAAEGLYDQVWPDIAELCRQFTDEVVRKISLSNREISAFPRSLVREAIAIAGIEPVAASMGELLRKLMLDEEKELLEKGEIIQKIGFVTEDALPILPVKVPYEKYRWGRAVAEVAREVNARRVIHVADGFLRDPETGKREGEQCLRALLIRPDGSLEASGCLIYRRENGRVRVEAGINVQDPTLEEQYLISAWCVADEALRSTLVQ